MHGMVSFNVHIKDFFILALRSNISYMEDTSPASSSESDGDLFEQFLVRK